MITLALMGTSTKAQMWDNIAPNETGKVLLRLSFATVGMPLSMLSLKYFPASIVRAGMSFGPIYAMILAWFLLGEKANARDLVSIGVGTAAVVMIMYSQVKTDLTDVESADTFAYNLAAFGVMAVPLLQSFSRIQLKQIKSMTPKAMVTYTNIILAVMGILAMTLIPGQTWTAIGLESTLLIVLISVFLVVAQIARLKAIHFLTINRMSIFSQLGLMMQLIIDITLLGATFTVVQWTGFGMMFVLYSILLTTFCFESSNVNEKDLQL